jgi:UDP-N-acetylglucosamine--N-acetylmuramyl-(pentapeptide) pyrophosphoryl-undecaprenol N-acetylglucosamine transferase
MTQTLMIAGGGTGGHIYPAIAIAQEYLSRDPKRRVVFVGTERGLEKTIVPKAGYPLEFISVGGLQGKSPVEFVKSLFQLPLGLIGAWRLIGKHNPAIVLGVGGYSSGPVLLAAALRGIPTMIDEQNAFPGITNRVLARFVKAVAAGFPDALTRLKRPDGVATGNPVRREFFEAAARPRESRPMQRLLIFGGSQGSRIINETLTEALLFLARLKDSIEIVHQTGPQNVASVAAAYKTSAFASARVVPYLDPIVGEIAAADLVVCRAGAMTLGELAAVGRASVLIPFAAATNNHQELNARVFQRAGASTVLTEAELTPERLASAVGAILRDPQKARSMGEAAKSLASPRASADIVDVIEGIQRK